MTVFEEFFFGVRMFGDIIQTVSLSEVLRERAIKRLA